MKKFVKPEIKIVQQKENYAKLWVEPLERGYATTIGNALRRVLISSIYGPSIFGLKIAGASHEFGILKGVRENISKIILNVRGIILKVNEDLFKKEELIEMSLVSENKKTLLKAGDIKVPAGVEILNKDLTLLHFENDAKVDIILYAKISHGYRTFQENKVECKEISNDVISTDSNFSPIRKVNFSFEDIKIGKNSDLERLVLEIETNGAFSPLESLGLSSNILIEYLSLFKQWDSFTNDSDDIFEKTEKKKEQVVTKITDLDLSQRVKNCLRNNQIDTLQELLKLSEQEVKKIKNLGKKSFNEVKDKVKELNLSFR